MYNSSSKWSIRARLPCSDSPAPGAPAPSPCQGARCRPRAPLTAPPWLCGTAVASMERRFMRIMRFYLDFLDIRSHCDKLSTASGPHIDPRAASEDWCDADLGEDVAARDGAAGRVASPPARGAPRRRRLQRRPLAAAAGWAAGAAHHAGGTQPAWRSGLGTASRPASTARRARGSSTPPSWSGSPSTRSWRWKSGTVRAGR